MLNFIEYSSVLFSVGETKCNIIYYKGSLFDNIRYNANIYFLI